MPNIDDKLNQFTAMIQADAAEESSRILAEIHQESAAALSEAENAYLAETFYYIKQEVARARTASGQRISKAQQAGKRTLYDRRSKITDGVMGDVRQRLLEYVATDEYAELLHSLVRRSIERFAGDEVQFYVRPADVDVLPAAKPDRRIQLGGLRAECPTRKQVLDLTFDSAFEEARGRMTELFGLELIRAQKTGV